jgi:hypothetical protein
MRSMSGDAANSGSPGAASLQPFGLVLHHDGRFTHEGAPIRNRLLREHFDRSVEYLPDESEYIVRLKHFRGQVEVEEAGFFVRSIDLASGEIALSDRRRSALPDQVGLGLRRTARTFHAFRTGGIFTGGRTRGRSLHRVDRRSAGRLSRHLISLQDRHTPFD